MKKILLSSILFSTIVFGSISASATDNFTGWRVDKTTGNWNYYFNDEKVHDGLIQQGNKLYYFDSLGNLINGWYSYGNAKMYLRDGVRSTGWKLIEGKWYYFNVAGIMLTGELDLNGETYNLASDGHLIE